MEKGRDVSQRTDGKARQPERRDCEKVLWLLLLSPEKWPRNRVEYALSPFSSIRLSGGGKHGAHPPRWIIPVTLLSPLTPTSRRSSLTCVHYDFVEHTNTHRRTSCCQPIFFSLPRYLFLFQMAVNSLNTRTHTCTQASSYQHLRCHISCSNFNHTFTKVY